jgi:hypothetical protein
MGWSDTFVETLKNNDVRFVTCVRGGAREV